MTWELGRTECPDGEVVIAYPVRIERDPDDPTTATVHYVDFTPDDDISIAWGSPEEMLRSAAAGLGTAYYLSEDEGRIPEPSHLKAAVSPRRVVGVVTCKYELFKRVALQVKEYTL